MEGSVGWQTQALAVASVLPAAAKRGAAIVVSTGVGAVERGARDSKELLEAWLKQKIHKKVEALVDKIPGIVKTSLEDPDMPRMISRGKDQTVDLVWPNVRDEIMWEVAVVLDGEPPQEEEDFGAACCCCRVFRYHLFPCDKSIWGQLRDPVYVLFMLVSLLPVTGLCSLIYLFIFLIIDRSDEYQLVQFILQFKGTQFLSHGIIRTLTGFFMYISCVTAGGSEWEHSCEDDGPGLAGRMEVILAGWVLQIALVWVAFSLLPCSKEKGRSQLAGNIEFEQTDRMRQKGGMLMYFLLWDIVSFLACTAWLVYVAATRPLGFIESYHDWVVQHVFFACQIVYGFLSMPFFFFTLPVLKVILTHAAPTAYNRNGVCCKVKGPERKRANQKEELMSEQDSSSILDIVRVSLFGDKAIADQ